MMNRIALHVVETSVVTLLKREVSFPVVVPNFASNLLVVLIQPTSTLFVKFAEEF